MTTPCPVGLMYIYYDWTLNPSPDLDTATTFLSETVGYACSGGGTYLDWYTGDCTSSYCFESVQVDLPQALADGAWSSSVSIDLACAWFVAGGTGSVTIRVEYCNTTKQKTITPVDGNGGCVSGFPVGTIIVNENGSFELY
jgi:hypothetical protein